MTNKNRFHYLLTCAAIILLAAVSCFTNGIIQLACGILISVLLGLQTVKYHYGYVAAAASVLFLVPLVICALFSDSSFGNAILYTSLMTVPFILMGLTLGFAANLKLSFYKSVLILTFIYLIGTLTNMKIMTSLSPAFGLENIIAEAVGRFQNVLNTVYASNPEILDIISPLLANIAKTILTLAPAIFTSLSLLTAFVCAELFKGICMKKQVDMSFWPPFYQLRADRVISVLFLIIFVLNSLSPEGFFADLTLNVIVILCAVFLLFGLSFVDWKMRSGGMKRFARRLILIAVIPLCTSFFMLPLLVLISLGVTDGLFHFRARKYKKTQ